MGGLIPQASTFAAEVDAMFNVVLVVTVVAFVLVEVILVVFLIRYRHREGREVTYTHGNRRVEITWTVLPGLGLLALGIYQYGAWNRIKIDLPSESEALVVGVSAKQFEWQATYSGEDGALGTSDDIVAPPRILHFPVDEKVIVRLVGDDVLHSFFIPAFRIKQDAVPGQPVDVWFEANQTGEFELACAELCGLGHYSMRGEVMVEPRAEFNAWLAEIAAR